MLPWSCPCFTIIGMGGRDIWKTGVPPPQLPCFAVLRIRGINCTIKAIHSSISKNLGVDNQRYEGQAQSQRRKTEDAPAS